MAKNSIRDFDNTAGNNTDIQSVDIAENCAPSGINNAIRELMADMADVNDGTVALVSPAMDSADINGGTIDGTVIGGTTPAAGTFTTGDFNTSLNVDGTITSDGLTLDNNGSIIFNDPQATDTILIGTNDDDLVIRADAGDILLKTNNNSTSVVVDALGQVGIGATTLDATLQVGVLGSTGSNRGAVSIKTEASDATIGESAIYIEEQSGSEGYYLGVSSDGGMFFSNSGASTPTLFLGDDDNVGIGTSSVDALLHLSKTTGGSVIRLENPDVGLSNGEVVGKIEFETQDAGGAGVNSFIQAVGRGTGGANNLEFATGTAGSPSVAMTIQSDQNVGIGTSSPITISSAGPTLEVSGTAGGTLVLTDSNATSGQRSKYLLSQGGALYIGDSADDGSSPSNNVVVDASGNLLVGHTGSIFNNINTTSTVGSSYSANGEIFACSDQSSGVMFLNRKTTDGVIATFRKDGSTVGSIASKDGDMAIGTGDTGLRFIDGSEAITPHNTSTNAGRDNAIDLGSSGSRFDDIFATNGTIQTSDQNEKQQIASLTDAEITAAKAISKLFKTFKWNDSVEEKGDAARTHAGVIAQDVQQAMSDAGLDAGDYAFFISATWWEAEIEVPAVEAVEAVDAVYDDDNNLVSEAVEAVEAQEAYTRTDTYDTAEEAPEGATERTRMGIRYPELLAFIGAATEQRLADIETRLTALEN